MKPLPLEELHNQLTPDAGAASGALLLPGIQREVGHFNVFNVVDLMPGYRDKPPMVFDRRTFYKISLICGRSRVEYVDKVIDVEQHAPWFATHRVPYRWLPRDPVQTGYFCIFTEGFLLPANGRTALNELPVFQPGAHPVLTVASTEYAAIEGIFGRWSGKLRLTMLTNTTRCVLTCWS